MSEDDLPTSWEESLQSLREVAEEQPRSIVHEDYARRVCETLGIDAPEDDLQRVGDMPAMVDPDDDALGIGFCYLLAHVVDELGGDATTSTPYAGRGLNAEKLSEANLEELNRLLDEDDT